MAESELSSKSIKPSLIEIQISSQQEEIIRQAATLSNRTVSEFIIENAYLSATQVLADKTRFVLSPEKWEEFCKALNEPPKVLPAIKELFQRPSPFNEDGSKTKTT